MVGWYTDEPEPYFDPSCGCGSSGGHYDTWEKVFKWYNSVFEMESVKNVDAAWESARLTDRRLDVKDVAHVLKAFKFYLCQLTHCAYDERTAQWIIDNWEQDYKRVEDYK